MPHLLIIGGSDAGISAALRAKQVQPKIEVTGDRGDGWLLGAQILGHRRSEVSKRIDIFATAIYNGYAG